MRSVNVLVDHALAYRARITQTGKDPEEAVFDVSPEEFAALLYAPKASIRYVLSEKRDRICGLRIRMAANDRR